MNGKSECCHVHNCQKPGLRQCARCKLVRYCSESCQKSEWKIHKEVCHVSLPLRLQGMARLLFKYTEKRLINISDHDKHIRVNGKKYDISAFGVWNLTSSCATCGARVDYEGPLMHVEVSFCYKNRMVEYYRCCECWREQKVLCEKSFTESTHCPLCRLPKVLLLATFAPRFLHQEVVHLILQLFASLPSRCCPSK